MHPQVQKWGDYLKRRLKMSRVMGILYCILCALSIVGLYFEEYLPFMNGFMCAMMIFFSIGGIFLQNATLQDIKRGKKHQIINIVFSIICFTIVVVLATLGVLEQYGFVSL